MKYDAVYVDPKVQLIDGSTFNIGYNLWLESRSNIVTVDDNGTPIKVGNEVIDPVEYKNRILKMGLQYNNFPYFVFEITGSALFRDLLFSINKCAMWATSLRFKCSLYEGFDLKNYEVSSEYKGIQVWEDQFDKYMDAIKASSITDENRLQMPYSMSSRYWIGMSFNDLLEILSLMKNRMPFFYQVYGIQMVAQVNDKLGIDILNFIKVENGPLVEQYFDHYESDEEYFKKDDGIVRVRIKMGLLLYSQFIRQTSTIIKGLFNKLEHSDVEEFKNKLFYAGTELNVLFVADESKFLKTIGNRCCWFSMSSGNGINSWSRFLNLVIKDLSLDEFKKLLPCKFNRLPEVSQCPFYDDVKFRDEGLEKRNLPCAIFNTSKEIIGEKPDGYSIGIAEKRNDYDKTELSNKYLQLTKELSL